MTQDKRSTEGLTSLDQWLEEEGILEKVVEAAIQRVKPMTQDMAERVARALLLMVGKPPYIWDDALAKEKETCRSLAQAAIEATGVVELRSELLCIASLLDAIYRGEKIMEQFPQSVKHALSKAQDVLALTQLAKGSE